MTTNQVEVNQRLFHDSVISFIEQVDSSDELKALGNVALTTLVSQKALISISDAFADWIEFFPELGSDFFSHITDSLIEKRINPTALDGEPFYLSVIDAIKKENSEDGIKVLIELAIDVIKLEGTGNAIVEAFKARASDFPGLVGEKFFTLSAETLLYRDSFQRELEARASRVQ